MSSTQHTVRRNLISADAYSCCSHVTRDPGDMTQCSCLSSGTQALLDLVAVLYL